MEDRDDGPSEPEPSDTWWRALSKRRGRGWVENTIAIIFLALAATILCSGMAMYVFAAILSMSAAAFGRGSGRSGGIALLASSVILALREGASC